LCEEGNYICVTHNVTLKGDNDTQKDVKSPLKYCVANKLEVHSLMLNCRKKYPVLCLLHANASTPTMELVHHELNVSFQS